ncbi:DUF2125 domain-containing protein [Profundibacterium mesophilum]|uniref:DUF2125 domain-containing protein n=1 Tax=Profundibacterium mesophilum KAUST100406-0324 TaxID=1037889 RepID=A0A921NQF8_9RHOB|nr:DUF2125 domain-containing protein [Profundibacterium mesophilum]KAF0676896.1 uncharacterized protein PMES_00692 [Profundibacterium mesophilum KAUST100406-0324]
MRKLILVLIAASILWGIYWFIGARTVERGFAGWIEQLRAGGTQIEVAAIDTRGLPNRFDTTLTDIALDLPDRSFSWRAPFAQVLALSYKPNHVIAVLPDRQSFEWRGTPLTLEAERLRGSLVMRPELALGLDRSSFVGEALALSGPGGSGLRVEELRLATRPGAGGARPVHDIGFELDDARLIAGRGNGPLAGLPDDLPELIERVRVDATVTFDAPLDRHAFVSAAPRPTRIDLRDARITWGMMELEAAGELRIGPDGVPEGAVSLAATQWREMLRLAVAAGLVDPGLSGTIETGMGLLAGLSGDGALRLPLTFAGGRMSLGPVPLGAAPRLFGPGSAGAPAR